MLKFKLKIENINLHNLYGLKIREAVMAHILKNVIKCIKGSGMIFPPQFIRLNSLFKKKKLEIHL